MRRFYVPPEDFVGSNATLNADETVHLRDVLRLRVGERVQVFDGNGKEFLCEIAIIEKKKTTLAVIAEISPKSPESPLDLTLAVAILKGEKFDLVIQKAVELGVTRFVPLLTNRADVKPKETEKKLERWRRIVLESSKQCGRAALMQIANPSHLDGFLKDSPGTKILFSERNGKDFSQILFSGQMAVIIGSEGGWDDSELEVAEKSGAQIVTLGGRILRAETAAIAISALVQNHFGDMK